MIISSTTHYYMITAPGSEDYREYDAFESTAADEEEALKEWDETLPEFYFRPKGMYAVEISKQEYNNWRRRRDKILKDKYNHMR